MATSILYDQIMKTINVSDELYGKLRDFVVDPFEDTPESILNRLVDIVSKTKARWSPVCSDQSVPARESADNNPDADSGNLTYRPTNEVAAD